MDYLFLMFITGFVEYLLAASWTRSLTQGKTMAVATITFTSAIIWGLLVQQVQILGLPGIAAHAIGCAIGAGLVCRKSNSSTEKK